MTDKLFGRRVIAIYFSPPLSLKSYFCNKLDVQKTKNVHDHLLACKRTELAVAIFLTFIRRAVRSNLGKPPFSILQSFPWRLAKQFSVEYCISPKQGHVLILWMPNGDTTQIFFSVCG